MAIHGKIKRYFLIIDKISRVGYSTLKELQDYLLTYDLEISRRTFVRDLAEIRYEFGIEIIYDHFRRGYTIDKENSRDLDTISRLLQTAISTEAVLDNIHDSKKMMSFIDYGSDVELKGMELFEPLLKAVKEYRVVMFNHENYNTETIKPYELRPYLLKEYQKRWYVVGTVNGTEKIRTFGIDRIEDFKLLSTTFKRDESLNPKPCFDDIIGLNYSEYEVEQVEIKLTSLQAKYLLAYPIHKTQRVVNDCDGGMVMQYFLKPNYEFQERLLMYGKNVTVLKPYWLRELMKEKLKEALANYY